MISQVAAPNENDEFKVQKFQGQKVTNLESGDQMNDRF